MVFIVRSKQTTMILSFKSVNFCPWNSCLMGKHWQIWKIQNHGGSFLNFLNDKKLFDFGKHTSGKFRPFHAFVSRTSWPIENGQSKTRMLYLDAKAVKRFRGCVVIFILVVVYWYQIPEIHGQYLHTCSLQDFWHKQK